VQRPLTGASRRAAFFMGRVALRQQVSAMRQEKQTIPSRAMSPFFEAPQIPLMAMWRFS
jgi:hypothetical protein